MMTARGGRELERLVRVWCCILRGDLQRPEEGDRETGVGEADAGVKDILSVLISGVEHRLKARRGQDVAKIVRKIVKQV